MRLKNWKMKPIDVRRSCGEPRLVERRRLRRRRGTPAARRPVDGADEIQQRRLAAARRAHQHREVAGGDLQRDVVEHVHRSGFIARAVIVADVLEGDAHWRCSRQLQLRDVRRHRARTALQWQAAARR